MTEPVTVHFARGSGIIADNGKGEVWQQLLWRVNRLVPNFSRQWMPGDLPPPRHLKEATGDVTADLVV